MIIVSTYGSDTTWAPYCRAMSTVSSVLSESMTKIWSKRPVALRRHFSMFADSFLVVTINETGITRWSSQHVSSSRDAVVRIDQLPGDRLGRVLRMRQRSPADG